MNTTQAAKYRRHFSESSRTLGNGPRAVTFSRTMRCNHCAFTVSRGRTGNALATVAKMRGEMMAHLRAKHSDLLTTEGR